MQNFVITQKQNIWFGSFPLLSAAGFVNACSCRLHGESDLAPGMLNLALHVGDDPAKVLHNRQLFAAALGLRPESFTTCQQVHGDRVAVVDAALAGAGALSLADTVTGTDALVTVLPNVPLLLFYADCVPILLADKRTGAIGLAHAGWRGTVAGIAAKTVQAMQEALGSRLQDILAAIGPSIGACCYEVDDFVRGRAQGYERFFAAVPDKLGHYMLDLWEYNRAVLLKAGVLPQHIAVSQVCTEHNSQLFCSHRAEHGYTGRMGVCLCRTAK